MNIFCFQASVADEKPPVKAGLAVQALWYAAKGDWETAHKTVQMDNSVSGAWVHAYVHRLEDDLSNAGYWYRKAGRPEASNFLQEEWREIAEALL